MNLISCYPTFGDCLGKNSELVKRKAHTYCNWLQYELDSIAVSLLCIAEMAMLSRMNGCKVTLSRQI